MATANERALDAFVGDSVADRDEHASVVGPFESHPRDRTLGGQTELQLLGLERGAELDRHRPALTVGPVTRELEHDVRTRAAAGLGARLARQRRVNHEQRDARHREPHDRRSSSRPPVRATRCHASVAVRPPSPAESTDASRAHHWLIVPSRTPRCKRRRRTIERGGSPRA
jgi:hypothetical protein